MTGIVKKVQLTNGSMFGHQIWTIEVDGKDRDFNMWESIGSSTWAKKGQKVEIEKLPDQTGHFGAAKVYLGNCARIVKILEE